jgi:Fe-S cluster assembly iron-binding protein IscA
MVEVTDKAREELRKLLLSSARDAETSIRLSYGTLGQFGLVLSREKDGDEVVQSHGLKVLLIGNEFMRLLDGMTFDVTSGPSKREFILTRQ